MKNDCAVIGLGRLGLCFALTLERAGIDVIGCDIREEHVEQINSKTFKSPEPNVENLLQASTRLTATTDLVTTLANADVIFVTVRTDSLEDGRFDHSQADKLVDDIISLGMQPTWKDLVLCCNVMPGYSDTVAERLEPYGYRVSFNPELIRQGCILNDQSTPDLVVIGEANRQAGDIIEAIYERICHNDPPVHRMNRISGELFKVALNCYLTTKISFANFVGDLATKAGGSPDSILSALGEDSRIGKKFLGYGFGYGGPCFPRDNDAMIACAEKQGLEALISKAVVERNARHLDFQVERFCQDKDIAEEVVITSVTYKPGVTIITESQQLLFAVKLAKKGYKVTIKEHPDVISQVRNIYGDIFKYIES